MMTIDDLAELAAKSGKLTDPKVLKVEPQVRTGVMFPLPDWMDTVKEAPDPRQQDKRR